MLTATKPYRYRTNCVNAKALDIHKMTGQAKDITYETFVKHCHGLQEWCQQNGYSINPGKSGNLTLKQDWAVTYYKSKYRGVKCYYMKHSAIEYIWTLGGE